MDDRNLLFHPPGNLDSPSNNFQFIAKTLPAEQEEVNAKTSFAKCKVKRTVRLDRVPGGEIQQRETVVVRLKLEERSPQ